MEFETIPHGVTLHEFQQQLERVHDGSAVQILRTNYDTFGCVIVRDNLPVPKTWVICERALYRPRDITSRKSKRIRIDYVEHPFDTEGTRFYLDVESGLYLREEFIAEEGQIQGLVYALDARDNGGELDVHSYNEYIRSLPNWASSAGTWQHSSEELRYQLLHGLPSVEQ